MDHLRPRVQRTLARTEIVSSKRDPFLHGFQDSYNVMDSSSPSKEINDGPRSLSKRGETEG